MTRSSRWVTGDEAKQILVSDVQKGRNEWNEARHITTHAHQAWQEGQTHWHSGAWAKLFFACHPSTSLPRWQLHCAGSRCPQGHCSGPAGCLQASAFSRKCDLPRGKEKYLNSNRKLSYFFCTSNQRSCNVVWLMSLVSTSAKHVVKLQELGTSAVLYQ